MSNIDRAYLYMVNLIAHGMEYPDAHTKAVTRYSVDGDELATMYDNDF